MELRSLGPPFSPGLLLHSSQPQTSTQLFPPSSSQPSSLLQSLRQIFPPSSSSSSSVPKRALYDLRNHWSDAHGTDELGVDEELVWWAHRVVWSKAGTVFRSFSYEELGEDVKWAGFGWFGSLEEAVEDDTFTSESSDLKQSRPLEDNSSQPLQSNTFGPFSTSQTAQWSDPRRKTLRPSPTASSRSPQPPKRALVVVFQTSLRVYHASGEEHVVSLPFPVSSIWAIQGGVGGLILERVGRKGNLDGVERMLFDEERDDAGSGSAGRSWEGSLYSLRHPSHELRPVGIAQQLAGGYPNEQGVAFRAERPSHVQPITSGIQVLMFESGKYPVVVMLEPKSNTIIFYRWARLPLPSLTASPTSSVQGTGTTDLLSPPLPTSALPLPTLPGSAVPRPSVNRKRSSYAPGVGDRRKSGVGIGTAVGGRSPGKNRRVSHGRDDGPEGSGGRMDAEGFGGPSAFAGVGSHPRTEGTGTGGGNEDRLLGLKRDRERERERALLIHAAESDLRETTMMMGLEGNENEGKGEFALEEIHRWNLPNNVQAPAMAFKVFLSDTTTPYSARINIHIAAPVSTLYIFELSLSADPDPRYAVRESRMLLASSAVPVICTRKGNKDVVIVEPLQGRVQGITNSGDMIPMVISKPHPLGTVVEEHDAMTDGLAGAEVVLLSDEAGSRVTMTLANGKQVRLDCDFTIKNRLVQQCLDALILVLPSSAYITIKILSCNKLQTATQLTPENRGRRGFEVFGQLIGSLLGLLDSTVESFRDPWEELLRDAIDGFVAPDLPALADKLGAPSWSFAGLTANCSERLSVNLIPSVILALHVVAEDCRLLATRTPDVVQLAKLLVWLSSAIGRRDFVDYWIRLVPVAAVARVPGYEHARDYPGQSQTPQQGPVNFFSLLVLRLQGKFISDKFLSPDLEATVGSQISADHAAVNPNREFTRLNILYSIISRNPPKPVPTEQSKRPIEGLRAVQLLLAMVHLDLDIKWVESLNPGIAIPVLEALKYCRESPATSWPIKAYVLLDRTDVACQLLLAQEAVVPISGRVNGVKIQRADSTQEEISNVLSEVGWNPTTSGQGPRQVAKQTEHHIPLPELRFVQDRRLQDVERMMQTSRVRIIRPEERNLSDHDDAEYHRSISENIATRTLSQLVGKALLTYGTQNPSATEKFDIPEIETRVYMTKTKSTLQSSKLLGPYDPLGWPSFHNGVAAGLSITVNAAKVDSSWIIFNKPATPSATHGGFLLGLGLTGHLRGMIAWHAYPYLEPRHELTSIGLLLGLAGSYMGSQDSLLTKILSLSVQALLPSGSVELNSSPCVQAASLLGIGLVYAGSRNHHMAEMALNEISRPPMVPALEPTGEHREAYSFSAACGFGLIMLGRGSRESSQIDDKLVSKLRKCIFGSAPPLDGGRSTLREETIDATVTAPGATLALGLMYLRSGREDIAAMISIPQNAFALDYVRPDLLLFRTLAINLIHWDTVEPTLEWIAKQVPAFISVAWDNRKTAGYFDQTLELAFYNIVAGACFVLGLKFASSMNESAHQVLVHYYGVFNMASSSQSVTYEAKLRRSAVRQGFGLVAISLALVVAGTGDLVAYRRLRVAHAQEQHYTIRTAIHAAVGVIFLGAGRYTLGSSNAAIASMIIAFFPRFPLQPDDNRAYLQAYRHLWALAIEPRCVMTTDVDSLSTVYLPVKVKVKEADGVKAKSAISPTLLAPFDRLVSIATHTPRFSSVLLNMSLAEDRAILLKSQMLFVKRKPAYLDYFSDPRGNRTFFVQSSAMTQNTSDWSHDLISGHGPNGIESKELQDVIKTHAGSGFLIPFAERFSTIGLKQSNSEPNSLGATFSLGAACEAAIIECILQDRLNILPIYLSLFLSFDFREPRYGMLDLQSLMFMRDYYSADIYDEDMNTDRTRNASPVIRRTTLVAAMELARPEVASDATLSASRLQYLRDGTLGSDIASITQLAHYLNVRRFPDVQTLETTHAHLMDLSARFPAPESSAKTQYLRMQLRKYIISAELIPPLPIREPTIPLALPYPDSNTDPEIKKRYEQREHERKTMIEARSLEVVRRVAGVARGWDDAGMTDACRAWIVMSQF